MARQREPGWYSDPDAPGHWRWWDGESWTEHAVSAYSEEHPGTSTASGTPGSPAGGGASTGGGPPAGGASPAADLGPAGGGPSAGRGPFAGGGPSAAAPGPAGSRTPAAAGPAGSSTPAAPPGPAGSRTPAAPPGPAGSRTPAAAPGPAGSRTPDAAPGPADYDVAVDERPTSPGGVPPLRPVSGRPRPGGGGGGPDVFAKRWAALIAVVALVVIVLAIALRGHPPALYWQGEPISNSQKVLAQAQNAMQSVAAADEGEISPQSRCYYSLPTRSAHDVASDLRCGPVLLPWSMAAQPWFDFKLSASPTSSGAEELSVAITPSPTFTVALAKGEVLRRPDGTSPPQGNAGLAVPAVPRQRAGWAGVLNAPPPSLQPAPADDLISDWGQSYRLVAYGDLGKLSANLDREALRVAVDPRGSAYSTEPSATRPLAPLLLPPKGQVFVVAELALSPGEAAGAVPLQANGARSIGADRPTLELLGGTTAATFGTSSARSSNLTVVASVPVDVEPVLQISDKGLVQTVLLANGRLGAGPSVLNRAGTNEVLSATGNLPGVTVRVSDAALVWFAGSDGGTVPPSPEEAYLEVLASASPPDASFLPASDFTLQTPGSQVTSAQALPDSDREAIVEGFLVPASFSDGTVVVSSGGRSFNVPVSFP